jgi:hypothetical protein
MCTWQIKDQRGCFFMNWSFAVGVSFYRTDQSLFLIHGCRAGAAKLLRDQNLLNAAAIASRRAAELYDLEVLDEGIQDFKENVTRFIVLSR